MTIVNQPARLYATAKTHKFNDLDEGTVETLKFRPIVDQAGTATYDAAKVIGEYLKPLSLKEYKINDCTLQFNKVNKWFSYLIFSSYHVYDI